MSENVPVIKRVSRPYTAVQAILAAFLIVIFWRTLVTGNLSLLWLFIVYVLYSLCGRYVVLRQHRRGIRQVKRGLFREAISAFGASYAFLSKHVWIDKYRWITIPSISEISYREMALCNIGYCFLRLEELDRAREFYSQAEKEFPKSELAKSGLAYLDSKTDIRN